MAPPVLRWIYGESRPCESIRPLDPIPREVVRRARIRVAAGQARKMQLRQIADLLDCVEDRASGWLPVGSPSDRRGVVKFAFMDHLQELEAAGLLRTRAYHWPIGYSGYFEVEKGADHSRAIFNGRRISRRFPAPPAVNLVTHRDIVE
jgi:hypothetical protein